MTGEIDKDENTHFDTLHETMSIRTTGVDVSGTQTGAGHTRITITPSLSMPKKSFKAQEEKPPKANSV